MCYNSLKGSEIVTYKKLAGLIGVSPSTVSKALSGSPEISRETADYIRREAERFGAVRPNYRREHSSKRVAVIVPEVISVYYSTAATSMIEELSGRGYEASIYICGFGDSRAFELLDLIESEKLADAIVMLSSIRNMQRRKLPIVTICDSKGGENCDSVCVDLRGGVLSVIEHLISLGHRRIGFIGERNTSIKLDYFLDACKKCGIEVSRKDIFVSSKRFEMIGVEGADYFFKMRSRPTAYLTVYDEVAFGAMHTFSAHGISVPGDVSIVGINDIPSSAFAQTPLTTLRTFSDEMMRIAVGLLIDKLEHPGERPFQMVKLRCELIIRGTTGPLGSGGGEVRRI